MYILHSFPLKRRELHACHEVWVTYRALWNSLEFLHTPKLLCILLDSMFTAGRTTRLLTENKRDPVLWEAVPSESRPESTGRWVYYREYQSEWLDNPRVWGDSANPEPGLFRQSPSTGWLGNHRARPVAWQSQGWRGTHGLYRYRPMRRVLWPMWHQRKGGKGGGEAESATINTVWCTVYSRPVAPFCAKVDNAHVYKA